MERLSDETLDKVSCNTILHQQVNQLDTQASQLQVLLCNLKSNLENLNIVLGKTKSSLRGLKLEISHSLESLQTLTKKISNEMYMEIARIKNPNTTLVNIAEKLLIILQQPDKSWRNFRNLAKDSCQLKNLMINFQPLRITPEISNDLLPIWKNYCFIQSRLQKYCIGVSILTEWIRSAIEYKVKQEAFEVSLKDHSKY